MTQLQNLTVLALLEEGYRPNIWMSVLAAASVMERNGLYCIFYADGSIAMYVQKSDFIFKTYNTRE